MVIQSPLRSKLIGLLLATLSCSGALVACDAPSGEGKTKVVAAFYPLAWAARQVGGDAVTVEDLTPKGAEPHDLQLTARQRLAIEDADLVLVLGKGFQPEVERAARDAHGRVVDLLDGIDLLPSTEADLKADPHVWLDPRLCGRSWPGSAKISRRSTPPGQADIGNARPTSLEAR